MMGGKYKCSAQVVIGSVPFEGISLAESLLPGPPGCAHASDVLRKTVCRCWTTGLVSAGVGGWATERASPQSKGSPSRPSSALSNPHAPLHALCHSAVWWGASPAWTDPCSGLRLGLLAHFPLASGRRATCSGSHQGEERGQGAKINRPSNLVHRLVLDGSVLGGKGEGGDHSWWEDIPPSWRG